MWIWFKGIQFKNLDHDGYGEVIQAGPYSSSRVEVWKMMANGSFVQLDYNNGPFAAFSPQLSSGVFDGGIGE